MFFTLLLACNGFADLGESKGARGVIYNHFNGKYSTGRRKHEFHEYKDEALSLREFYNQENKVFAISWKGSKCPDLRKIFAGKYTLFKGEIKNLRRAGHLQMKKGFTINNEEIQIFHKGHMRDYHGIVVLKKIAPKEFKLEDLQVD